MDQHRQPLKNLTKQSMISGKKWRYDVNDDKDNQLFNYKKSVYKKSILRNIITH